MYYKLSQRDAFNPVAEERIDMGACVPVFIAVVKARFTSLLIDKWAASVVVGYTQESLTYYHRYSATSLVHVIYPYSFAALVAN